MVSGTVWSKFFWSDWANDKALQLCSFAAQGLWMRVLCIAAEANPTGYVTVNGNALDETGIARLTGANVSEVANLLGELERNGVFSRDRQHRIYSRRMVRDAKMRVEAQKNGKNGGNPSLRKQSGIPPPVNPPLKGTDNTHKPEATSLEENNLAQQPIAARREDVLEKLLEAAGVVGNPPTGLAFPGQIHGLIEAGYDLEADILPAIRAKPNPRARTWGYFVPQIRDAVAARQEIAKERRPVPVDPLAVVASWPLEKWQIVLEHSRERMEWRRQTYGPPPFTPGCLVPAELLTPRDRELAA